MLLIYKSNTSYGQSIQRSYDSLGRITQIVYPDSSIITYTYDNNGNLIHKQTHDPCNIKVRPTVMPLGQLIFCAGDTLELTTEPALAYQWSTGDTTQTIKVTATGNYSITIIDSFWVYDDTLQCQLTSDSVGVYVKSLPDIIPTSDIEYCNGDTTITITFNSTSDSTVLNWAGSTNLIGLSQNGNGNIPSFTAVNTGNTTILDTIIVTPFRNDCYGKPDTFTIAVHPTPVIDTISNQAICNGHNSTIVQFNSSVLGTQFTWTNTDTSIGLAASGNNSFPVFTAQNQTNTPVVASVTLIGTYSGCSSISENFTITVNPTPDIDTVTGQELCNGVSTTTINFTGSVNGTTYNWTNDKTSIGLSATGTNTIASFTGNNQTNLPITANIIVTPVANQCTGQQETFSITVNPTPSVNNVSNQVVCNGENAGNVVFSGNVSNAIYTWSNSKTTIGLGASGIDSIPSFTSLNTGTTPVTASISVSPSANNCVGTSSGFTITVNPTPTVNPVANQNLCNGINTTAINFTGSVTNTTYHWSNNNYTIGLDSVGVGNITAFQATNTSNVIANATITVVPNTNNCIGQSEDFTITVKPTPTVNTHSNQVVCNGDTSTSVMFTGSVTSSVYSWSNSDTSIGLGISGIDSIPSFTATNVTNTPRTAIITTIPTANGCSGGADTFSILVNPTPSVDTISDLIYCNGDMLQTIPFTGTVSNASYHWTNDKSTIGLDSVGINNITPFTILNSDSIPVIANIVVVPKANNCSGPSKNFSITVNPTPNVIPTADQILCNGSPTDSITFNGSVANTNYNWTNTDSTIGLGNSGIGNIVSFTATSNSTVPITGVISVTPIANNCPGTVDTFSITVNPTPNVFPSSDILICNKDTARFVNFGGYVFGTIFIWTNSDTTIGLKDTDTGNISAFSVTNNSNIVKTAIIEVVPYAYNCEGIPDIFSIAVKPTPVLDTITDQYVCNNLPTDSIVFISSVSGSTFSTWSDRLIDIGYSGTSSVGIPSFIAHNSSDTPVIATIKVSTIASGCIGIPDTFTMTINPTPKADTIVSQIVCEHDSTQKISFTGTINPTDYHWINSDSTIGLSDTGVNDISKFKAHNPTDTIKTAVITVKPVARTCIGSLRSFSITVKPEPKVDTIIDFVLCNTDTFTGIKFTSPVLNSTYQWSNSDTTIGLNLIGVDSITSFQTKNITNKPTIATITVTPSANNCIGDSIQFNIRINPTPILDTIPSTIHCNNDIIDTIFFISSVDSTLFNWTNDNTSIGLAAIGSGAIHGFTIKNSDSIQSEAYITVTPKAYGCEGMSQTFSLKTNPTLIPNIEISSTLGTVICKNMLDTFVSQITNGGSKPSYQWKTNGIIVGEDSSMYITPLLSDGDIITCELSSNAICVDPQKTNSNSIQMTVKPNLTPVVEVTSTYANLWDELAFHVNTLYGGQSPIYMWRKNGTYINGVTGDSYVGIAGVDFLPGDVVCVIVKSNEMCLAIDTGIACSKEVNISGINAKGIFDNITLYPNPNSGSFILDGHIFTEKQIDIEILDASGKMIYTDAIMPVKNTIHKEIKLSDHANGTYYIRFSLDKERKSKRFEIAR